MPRRSRNLGAGSQGPLRGIADLMKNLDPGQQDRLRSALVDAENQLSFHSLNTPEKQQIRRISGLVAKIQVTSVNSILGGFLSWSRLDDPRISFYEVQVSDDSVFSNPETYQVLDTFFSIEGALITKYARVRGVRLDGETGVWSSTQTLSPTFIAPQAHSIEFYPGYTNNSDATPQRSFFFAGNAEHDYNDFYTILSTSFYVNRFNGGLSIWGYVSNRLKNFTEHRGVPWDRIRFTVNGIHRMDSYFPHWTNNFDIDYPHESNDFDANGNLISFYSKGGYTATFGPYGVSVPNVLEGQGPNDPKRITVQESADGSFYWSNFGLAKKPARFDEAQLSAFNDTASGDEAAAFNLRSLQSTEWIVFQNFGFSIPSDRDIVGIEAKVKRRQPNQYQDQIHVNLGVVRPDIDEGEDVVCEYRVSESGAVLADKSNILEDPSFGRYLDLTIGSRDSSIAVDAAPLFLDPDGFQDIPSQDPSELVKLWTGDQVTFSQWILIPSDLDFAPAGGRNIITISGAASALNRHITQINTDSTSSTITSYFIRVGGNLTSNFGTLGSRTATLSIGSSDPLSQVGKFHHFVWSYDNTAGLSVGAALKMYVNGVEKSPTLTSGLPIFTGFKNIDPGTNFGLGVGGAQTANGQSVIGIAQFGIWGKILTAAEIKSLYEAGGTADYRLNFGDYKSANSLNHYFLRFPSQANIQDKRVVLTTPSATGTTSFRTDLEDKALSEVWPKLGQFFYTDTRQCDTLPLASSDGIPHDNHTAIGYQSYGGYGDLWGGIWTPSDINEFYFGVAIQAQNVTTDTFNNSAFIDNVQMTVYTNPIADREINVAVSAAVNNFYLLEREVFGAAINAIEIGELINA